MANTSNRPGEWEDEWREAFEEAEASPSPHVWKNIESALLAQETGKYRKGFLFYRTIAAALLLLIAGLSWYIIIHQNGENDTLSDSRTPQNLPVPVPSNTPPVEQPSASSMPPTSSRSTSLEKDREATEGNRDEKAVASPRSSENLPLPAYQDANIPASASSLRPEITRKEKAGPTSAAVQRPPLASSGSTAKVSPPDQSKMAGQESPRSGELLAPDPLSAQAVGASYLPERLAAHGIEQAVRLPSTQNEVLYRVPQPFAAHKDKEKSSGRAFFAGLALAPGYFDPQLQASPGIAEAVSFAPTAPSGAPGVSSGDRNGSLYDDSSIPPESSGINDYPELSFTYGVDVGMKLSDHWIVESGIDYNRFNTNTETRFGVADLASGNQYAFLASNRYALEGASGAKPISTTQINNNYEFISVPLQIGYQVAISKLHFMVSSGVAANFFLGNTISAPSSDLSEMRVSPTTDSPFRSSYYSGVLSGGLNYNVSGNYFLSFTPSYTFALTELTREGSALNSQPYSFGINVGLQYQF